MLRKEALFVLTSLSRLIVTKLEKPLSQVRGWVNGRISIAVVRLTNVWSMELASPVPCRDRGWTGTWYWASS